MVRMPLALKLLYSASILRRRYIHGNKGVLGSFSFSTYGGNVIQSAFSNHNILGAVVQCNAQSLTNKIVWYLIQLFITVLMSRTFVCLIASSMGLA